MYEFTGKVKVVGELQTLAPTLLFFGHNKLRPSRREGDVRKHGGERYSTCKIF